MDVSDIKELFQPSNGLHVFRVVHIVEFDIELIDLVERAVGCKQKGIPLRTFDIDLHHERRRRLTVTRELARQRVEWTAVLRGFGGADALAMENRLAAGA